MHMQMHMHMHMPMPMRHAGCGVRGAGVHTREYAHAQQANGVRQES